ncbi:sensor histidine kinase [Desulfurivibrio sp. D14AmB]|uniref:sensor histidine kinase n=1 Tax=Desulfurivibrio sp. D14AmB TaxID=3374370 RepID=UPI00376F08BE
MAATATPFFLFFVYLFYGAAFFAIGVAIVSRLKTLANLQLAGLFRLLALFAFSHSLHEWLELFLFLELTINSAQLQVRLFSLLLLLLSFLFLFAFGINIHHKLNTGSRPYLIGLLLAAMGLFFLLLQSHLVLQNQEYLNVIDYSIRKLFALPATLLAGSGFILYARRLRDLSSKGAGNFTGAGLAMLAYGIFTGLFPSTATLLLLPIQLWRGLTALVILHFIMYALNIFLAQRDAMISEKLQRTAHGEKLGSIGRLAAGIAHELNNPLANASLQMELLRQDQAVTALPEKSLARLRTIERNVEKTAQIAGELLFFADRRQESTPVEAVNLKTVVDLVWQGLSPRQQNCRLDNNLPNDLQIEGVALKLEQLFRNLLLNALDAMPDGGEITINLQEQGERLTITILDRGEGIEPDQQNLIMEPFFTTKEVGKGTGLGLTICYGIISQHGGTMEIAPRPDGKGTAVTLTFPKQRRQGGLEPL